jgi:methionyl-tRNA formyltransferase
MSLRVVFFGSGEFAVPILDRLARRAQVEGVVTTPPGRSRRGAPLPSPVAQAAAARQLTVWTPARGQWAELVEEVSRRHPDALFVADYGRILPQALVRTAPVAVNVHPSLLPRHRGPAPLAWTLLCGDAETGVTLLGITPEVDAGPVYDQVRVPVGPDEDAGALTARLAELAANRVTLLLERLRRGESLEGRPQEGTPTYARRLQAEDEILDFSRPALEVVRRVRALSPRPGARTSDPDGPLLVLAAQVRDGAPAGEPGSLGVGQDGVPVVRAGDGRGVALLRVRPAGRRTMEGTAYLRGRRWTSGVRLGARGPAQGGGVGHGGG